MIPEQLANLVAIILPWIEVVAGLCLMTGVWPRAAAWVATLLCLSFVAAVGQALVRDLNIQCGCFGSIDAGPIGLKKLGQSALLLAVAAWLAWRSRE